VDRQGTADGSTSQPQGSKLIAQVTLALYALKLASFGCVHCPVCSVSYPLVADVNKDVPRNS
jgi:hypothetical protein